MRKIWSGLGAAGCLALVLLLWGCDSSERASRRPVLPDATPPPLPAQCQKLPGVDIFDISERRPEGAPYNQPGNLRMDAQGACVRLGARFHSQQLTVSFDNDDRYTLELYDGSTLRGKVIAEGPPLATGGMRIYRLDLPESVGREGFSSVRILPSGGDGTYSLGHLDLGQLGSPPQLEILERRFEAFAKDRPMPRELWPRIAENFVPLARVQKSDVEVESETRPGLKLRRREGVFHTQKLRGRRWLSPYVLLAAKRDAPAQTPSRAVVIASPMWEGYFPNHVSLYADRIASVTGYPTLVVGNPGLFENGEDIELAMPGLMMQLRKSSSEPFYVAPAMTAVVFVRALDALEEMLGTDALKAVIIGHSKRGSGALFASAVDDRVAGTLCMGSEETHSTLRQDTFVSFHYTFYQDAVKTPVMYLGVSNEDGYEMFNINRMQSMLKRKMTLEIIANYGHSNFHHIQYLDALMWVKHVFDGRPLTRINEVSHQRQGRATAFEARVRSEAKVRMVRAWYAYADNPQWRDLMWYHVNMVPKPGSKERYIASLAGRLPDAFYVEVADIAQGVEGYVSSLPQKLSAAPVVRRQGAGNIPRLWRP